MVVVALDAAVNGLDCVFVKGAPAVVDAGVAILESVRPDGALLTVLLGIFFLLLFILVCPNRGSIGFFWTVRLNRVANVVRIDGVFFFIAGQADESTPS